MVERERDDEGEAKASSGPLLEGDEEEAKSERGQKRGHEEEELKDEEEEEEHEQEWSEIRLAIEQLSPARLRRGGGKPAFTPASPPATLPFLGLSHLLLQVLDKIGPTMAVLRLDVQRNIERVQELYLLDPSKYSTLTEIVEKEVKEGTARKVDSCARAVLWLTRSMDFTNALLQRLGEDTDQHQSFAQLVEGAYTVTLKPWHGWISSAAYKIGMKLVPERKIFTGLLVGTGQDWTALKNEIEKLAVLLQPLLDDIHSMMAKFRLDRLKST